MFCDDSTKRADSEYVTDEAESMTLLRNCLENSLKKDKISKILRTIIEKDIDKRFEPKFDNDDWKIYRIDFDDTKSTMVPVFEVLLRSVEHIKIEQSTKVVEFLLKYLPFKFWNTAKRTAAEIVLSIHKEKPSKETEEAILNILNSLNPKIKLETIFLLSDSEYHTTEKIIETLVDFLFEKDTGVRIATATTLVEYSKKINRSSKYYRRLCYARYDPCPIVAEAIQTIIAV